MTVEESRHSLFFCSSSRCCRKQIFTNMRAGGWSRSYRETKSTPSAVSLSLSYLSPFKSLVLLHWEVFCWQLWILVKPQPNALILTGQQWLQVRLLQRACYELIHRFVRSPEVKAWGWNWAHSETLPSAHFLTKESLLGFSKQGKRISALAFDQQYPKASLFTSQDSCCQIFNNANAIDETVRSQNQQLEVT